MKRLIPALALSCAVAFSGCATVKGVLRTVDEIADAACNLFGEENPAEFVELVTRVKPDLGPKLDRTVLDVKKLCDLKEVVQPFVNDQLRAQSARRAALGRASSGGEADAGGQ